MALVWLIAASGCERNKPEPVPPGPPPTAPAKPSEGEQLRAFLSEKGESSMLPPGHPPVPGLPQGHPPIDGQSAGGDPHAQMLAGLDSAPSPAPEAPLAFESPEGWIEETVIRPFRRAVFTLPRADSDAEDGQLIVFWFGPCEGGDVMANIERWRSMFHTAEGEPVPPAASRLETFEVDGLSTTVLDVAGYYHDPMMSPLRTGPTETPYRLLGAVVETSEGPWFFKAVGPAPTMAQHYEPFMALVRSIRRQVPPTPTTSAPAT